MPLALTAVGVSCESSASERGAVDSPLLLLLDVELVIVAVVLVIMIHVSGQCERMRWYSLLLSIQSSSHGQFDARVSA